MIEVYNLLNNDKKHPQLNVVTELNIDGKNVSIEKTIEILNEFFSMDKLSVEHAYLVGFNLSMDIMGIFLISIGNSRNCFFYKKSIATFLLLSGAERFVLFHNHPDGTLEVSDDDNVSMFYIKSLADILEVEFIDSVIISKNGWRCINRNEICEYDEEDTI